MKTVAVLLFLLGIAPRSFAQRDFLTTNEVEQVRDTQEPNARLKLYILFARQRMDQFQQLLKKDRKGRSLEARQLLEDYASIIDALDNVSDDALKRHVAIKEGLDAAATAEKRFLSQLQKIEETPPADMDLYDTAFKEAIAATSDAIELAQGDTSSRATELAEKEEKEKNESKSILAAEDGKGSPAQTASAADGQTAPVKPKRKPPTLMRPGEKPPDN